MRIFINKTCCITGHRPTKLPWKYTAKGKEYNKYIRQLTKIVKSLMKQGYTHFISGMALGVDIDFAQMIIHMRDNKKLQITLERAIPCPNQDIKWIPSSKLLYHKILSRADKVTTVSPSYTFSCMYDRNRSMVNNSDTLIAVWNGAESGGTWYTMYYAKQIDTPIIIIGV